MNSISFPKLGIELNLNNVAFQIGDFQVYWYGILIGLGLILAILYAYRNSNRFGVDNDRMFEVIIGGLIGGIVGARLYYVIFSWDMYKDDLTEVCPYTFEDALIFTNLELFRQEGLKKMGTITTIANLLKHSNSANELQNKIFKKLESKSGFQKADFAISLLYKDDFVDLVAPVYIQEGLEWMKSYLDSNGNRNGE